MDQNLKRKWIEALRSGKYRQGYDRLHRGQTFCCLGVLCEVAGFDWEPTETPEIFRCRAGVDYIEEPDILEEFGLDEKDHELLYCMNDGTFPDMVQPPTGNERVHSFLEIADWIEEHL